MSSHHVLSDPVLIVLFAASLVSWAIIVDCLILLRRSVRDDAAFGRGELAPNAPLARLQYELGRHAEVGREHLSVLMDTCIAIQRQRLERMLPALGAIGSTAPYVGLLGTVIGIIQAFQAIQNANNMSPSIVAGGIATALIATAAGLAVAIPAVVAHHLISSAIGRRMTAWEAEVAKWLPREMRKGIEHESLPVA